MDIVIDSNCVTCLTKKRPDGQVDDITGLVEKGLVRIAVDRQRAIESEWKKTAGEEAVKGLMVRWHDARGLVIVRRDGVLHRDLRARLDELAFNDQIDRWIIRTALVTTDRQIVSEDPDFWDPRRRDSKGKPDAPVAKLLRDEHGIEVETLRAFVGSVRPPAPAAPANAVRRRR
jgi:hypothetical protein